MKSKLILRHKCLEKREKFFKKKGNDCLKTIDFNLIEYDPFDVPSADDTWEHHEEDKNKGVFKL